MSKFIIIILILLLFTSCSDNEAKNEDERAQVLTIEEFTNLMTDVQLLEGHLNTNRVNQVFIMDSSKKYYKEIFNAHGITFEEYKQNLKYYTAHPKVLEEVYNKVEEHLVIQERLYKDILIDQPAISPINRSQLLKIIVSETLLTKLVLDTSFQYKVNKDSLFGFYSDSLLKEHHTNVLSFQQSFNVSTHTIPLFNVFRNELKNKLEKIKGID
jgi:hypothetical protein